ncbi:MAG: molybdopterin converting factor subunit 1 [Microscillaceae bacterium]|nr:molybdopterin converting factor subunit 1 [Microscillaceae bacterium]
MKLQIKLFGIAREMAGSSTLEIELEESATIKDFKQTLFTVLPDLARLRTLMVAVNTDYGEDDTILRSDDEIAVIPPVSGG